MKKEEFKIGNTPVVYYGEKTDKLFVFVHGQCGNKYEAERFAEIAAETGWQTIAADLPEHGGRTDSAKFVPWDVIPELRAFLDYARADQNRKRIALRAISVGSWFSLSAFADEKFAGTLLSSPLLNMEAMIEGMMAASGVSEQELEQKGEILTENAVLSWRYLQFARKNRVRAISPVTDILFGSRDELIPRATIERFARENPCRLTEIDGMHWLHTENELRAMGKWEKAALNEML